MNLHFFVDEKVVSMTIERYERLMPGQNKFIVVIPSANYVPKHVKIDGDNITYATYKSKKFYEAIGDLIEYKFVVIHLLTPQMVDFVNHHPHPAYWWVCWGSDLYNDLLEYKGLQCYYDKAEAYRMQRRYSYCSFMKPIKWIFNQWKVKQREHAIERITYIGAAKGDYDLLLKYCPNLCHLQRRATGGYYPIDSMVDTTMLNQEFGNNIIVGNSAYAAGNHVEVFRQLAQYPLGNRKVITPLSYGDVAPYVEAKGKEILGDNFVPVLNFMPLDEYNKLLHSASTFIYNNYRQAAFGNIIAALYMGATVFMNEKCPSVPYFRDELGCIFFLTNQLHDKISYRLTKEEVAHNRNVILKRYSKEAIDSMTIKAFS